MGADHHAAAGRDTDHPQGRRSRSNPPAPTWVRIVLAVLALGTVLSAVFTWPTGDRLDTSQGAVFVHGVVRATAPTGCGSVQCANVTIELLDGPEAGTTTDLVFPPGRASDPGLTPGLHVRLARGDGGGTAPVSYEYDDIERGQSLLILALVFAVLVALVARWRGLAALIGLAVTFAVLVEYLLPKLLDGGSPTLTAMTAAGAIVFVAVPLAHGRGVKSAIAILGTLLGTALCAAFATVGVGVAHLTGLSTDEVPTLIALGSPTTVQGLVLCGAIVGSIGVLNDVTITQASAVVELAAAAPEASRASLIAAGMRVGKDHIASTVYTLALAYAGSALPILLLLTSSGRAGVDAFTSDIVAGEIIRSLAGGVGLVLAVPVTTVLAAACIRRRPAVQAAASPDDDAAARPWLQVTRTDGP